MTPTSQQGQSQVSLIDFLSAFNLEPRKCEDCGVVFTVLPYIECAKWRHCTPCVEKRFHLWIKTPEAKNIFEMLKLNYTE